MSWNILLLFIFFFKQKTAYDMRISDWSSDVCSSDLVRHQRSQPVELAWQQRLVAHPQTTSVGWVTGGKGASRKAGRSAAAPVSGTSIALARYQIGRASCRERVCQYV